MQLTVGTALKQYAILEPIGRGGMGEVYRAKDTSLGRDVAIKVLPPDVATDQERLARFQREAQMLAALNHPRIASIYGLEDGAGIPFLVIELVEGDDLAARMQKRRFETDEIVGIARQLAEALEAAHERGIVHRDLKPANVMLTPDGDVKVLDFGLARVFTDDGPSESSSDLTNSPTLARNMTHAGVILGTAAYMSPEQARGKRVDKRSDIWSYGVLLFELIAGRKLFEGETVSDTLAAVLRQEIDWSAVPPDTPASLLAVLRRCLVRNPSERLRDIGEVRIALSSSMPAVETPPRNRPRRAAVATITAIAAIVLALGLGVIALLGRAPAAPKKVIHASVDLPPGVALSFGLSMPPALAISPDGSTIAFAGMAESEDQWTAQLYTRRLDEPEARLIPDTRGARAPFFSPDGKWVAFSAGNALWKVPVSGGAPTKLVEDVSNSWGGSWTADGTIIYSNFLATGEALFAVDAAGGAPRVLKKMPKLIEDYSFPQPLSRNELIMTRWLGGSYANARIDYIDLEKGTETPLLEGGSITQVLDTGHLVYGRAAQLFAVPFDREGRRLAGTPRSLLSGILIDARYSTPQFALAPSGTLVYAPAGKPQQAFLSWLDASGHEEPLAAASQLDFARLAPDGRTIVYNGGEDDNLDVWTLDTKTRRKLRLTTAMGEEYAPVLTASGRSVLFAAWRDTHDLRRIAVGGGTEERIASITAGIDALSLGPGDRWLAMEAKPKRSSDIGVIDLQAGTYETRWILDGPFTERAPAFSPVSERLAYVSDRTGRPEVWVRAAIDDEATILVSLEGGDAPFWSLDGRTLYFTNGRRLFAAAVTTDGPLEASEPRFIMETGPATIVAIAPDGRFLAHRREIPRVDRLRVIVNFDEEVTRAFASR